MYTDNPLADFAAYELEQEKRIEKLPRCSHCDEPTWMNTVTWSMMNQSVKGA